MAPVVEPNLNVHKKHLKVTVGQKGTSLHKSTKSDIVNDEAKPTIFLSGLWVLCYKDHGDGGLVVL